MDAGRGHGEVEPAERAHPVDAAADDVLEVAGVVVRLTPSTPLSGVEAGAELEARDARREIGGLVVVAGVEDLELDQVGRVAVDAAGAGLGVRAADAHDVVGAVLLAELDPAEVAREVQPDLVDEGVVEVAQAAADLELELAAVEDAALGRAVGVDEDLVVHEEGVVAVVVRVGERVLGGRADAELGVAAEHDLDAADRVVSCAWAPPDIRRPALTSAVLPNNSLCCMIPFSTRTRKGVRFYLRVNCVTRSPNDQANSQACLLTT